MKNTFIKIFWRFDPIFIIFKMMTKFCKDALNFKPFRWVSFASLYADGRTDKQIRWCLRVLRFYIFTNALIKCVNVSTMLGISFKEMHLIEIKVCPLNLETLNFKFNNLETQFEERIIFKYSFKTWPKQLVYIILWKR